MQDVASLAREIIAREGGFVNDPDDPGGATNHGVTIGTLRRLGIDLTGDGAVDVADVRALSQADAEAIFLRDYFERPGIDRLPEPLRLADPDGDPAEVDTEAGDEELPAFLADTDEDEHLVAAE